MAIPQWLAILIAVVVLAYGGYRMWLAVAGPSNEARAEARTGMLAMSRRSHGLVAILLWIAGGMLMGTAFGWKPFATKTAEPPTAPAPGSARPALPVR